MTGLHTPLLATALFISVAAVGLTPALAQTAAPANAGPAAGEAHHRARAQMMPGQFLEGRIAFFKAELKITPAQEAQWQQVEATMRENAKVLDQTISAARQNRAGMNAIQRLELRDQFAKVRSDNNSRFLAAFKPLYASLSPEQQSMADQLIEVAQHRRHRRA
jgi:Spy/CpxP family protein refolding chaperone